MVFLGEVEAGLVIAVLVRRVVEAEAGDVLEGAQMEGFPGLTPQAGDGRTVGRGWVGWSHYESPAGGTFRGKQVIPDPADGSD